MLILCQCACVFGCVPISPIYPAVFWLVQQLTGQLLGSTTVVSLGLLEDELQESKEDTLVEPNL